MDLLPSMFLILLLTVTVIADDSLPSRKLLIILIDGFRWNYFEKLDGQESGFDSVTSRGVKAEYMKPAFPSLSFPNYYTIMTGRTPEHHGLVNNEIYDKEHDAFFAPHDHKNFLKDSVKNFWYKDGEPIWITAKKQGLDSHMFYMRTCNGDIPYSDQVFCENPAKTPTPEEFTDSLHQAIQELVDDKIDLAVAYYGSVDHTAHVYGPESSEVKTQVELVDRAVLTLEQQLKTGKTKDGQSLSEVINLIIVSDHGAETVSQDKTVNLTQYMDMEAIEQTTVGTTVYGIWPKEDQVKKVYEDLKDKSNFKVYRREDIPKRWYYAGHSHTPPITVVAEPGYLLLSPDQLVYPLMEHKPKAGDHGYDNDLETMWAIFIAAGPNFNQNQLIPSIESRDVYQAFCKVLRIKPAENDGDRKNILVAFRKNPVVSFMSVIVTGVVSFFVMGFVCLSALILYSYRHKVKTRYRKLPENDSQFEL